MPDITPHDQPSVSDPLGYDDSLPQYHRSERLIGRIIFSCLFVMFLLLLTQGSLMATPNNPSANFNDKVMHFIAYLILTGLMGAAFPRLKLVGVFLIPFIYGIQIEALQAMSAAGRTASWADMLANGFGGGIALLLWMFYCRIIRARTKAG